jgi:hypothetical protein
VLDALGATESLDRTNINAWEDVEVRRAIEETGRRKLIIAALWTEACLLFPALDVMQRLTSLPSVRANAQANLTSLVV